MKNAKSIVQQKYAEIVLDQSDCCGGSTNCCGPESYTIFSEDYKQLEGYDKDADLNLGCGIPSKYAEMKEGNAVLDLGSGAGNDCFVARAIVGESGSVTGIDFTDAMINKARANNKKTAFKNVEFIKGDIENMPLKNNQFDVIISNCVLNLVPDKVKAFAEMYRVLKPGAHFCVSDVVIKGVLPEQLKESADLYAGCVTGAIDKNLYLDGIKEAGFQDIEVKSEKIIALPDELLNEYLNPNELANYRESEVGVYSITVNGYKVS